MKMTGFLANHQLNIMLVLSGVCFITAVFVLLSNSMKKNRKLVMAAMEVSGGFLLVFDRYAYIYRGDVSRTGFIMVRLSNFMVFFLTLAVLFTLNLYIKDVMTNEGGIEHEPRRTVFCDNLIWLGGVLLILSQFTGLYYTFDENNVYQRSPWFIICYIIPLVVMLTELSVIIQYGNRLSFITALSLVLFTTIPLIASILQLFMYGVSLVNISMVGFTVVVYIFEIVDANDRLERANRLESVYMKEGQDRMHELFDETTKALVNAVDVKNESTRGHSGRVAHYAVKIAELSGKSEKECEEVYYAALLHDVGKIGTPDRLLEKKSGLTAEEEQIKKDHTLIGNQILSNISEYPALSVGAYYHHEKYDGTGYPNGLKGREIPEIARIIAVADAYDVMITGDGSEEELSIEQAREELIRGAGSRFDPEFARAMAHFIDVGSGYSQKEKDEIRGYPDGMEIHFDGYREIVTDGIELTNNVLELHLECCQDEDFLQYECFPAIILFDSSDGKMQDDAKRIEEFAYIEYGEIWFDGHTICTEARNMKVSIGQTDKEACEGWAAYDIEAVRFKDHILIRINGNGRSIEVITALPDSTRYAYIGLSGEHCTIRDISVRKSDELIKEGYIPRIAEEISYIDRIEGDIPNVQIDGYRTDATEGIPINDGLKLMFHTMSLPSARTVWHCPLIVIFYSADSMVYGEDYREYALISLDGEKRESDGDSDNRLEVSKGEGFPGWEFWKEKNKKGYDSEVVIKRKRNRIVVSTDNMDIHVRNTTVVNDGTTELYAALTGDQCALTDIRMI